MANGPTPIEVCFPRQVTAHQHQGDTLLNCVFCNTILDVSLLSCSV
jgi:hypothetical protein